MFPLIFKLLVMAGIPHIIIEQIKSRKSIKAMEVRRTLTDPWKMNKKILLKKAFCQSDHFTEGDPLKFSRAPFQPVPPCLGTGYFFSLEVSKVSKVSYFSRFHNQKVSNWHWLIFTPFGALGSSKVYSKVF